MHEYKEYNDDRGVFRRSFSPKYPSDNNSIIISSRTAVVGYLSMSSTRITPMWPKLTQNEPYVFAFSATGTPSNWSIPSSARLFLMSSSNSLPAISRAGRLRHDAFENSLELICEQPPSRLGTKRCKIRIYPRFMTRHVCRYSLKGRYINFSATLDDDSSSRVAPTPRHSTAPASLTRRAKRRRCNVRTTERSTTRTLALG